MSMCRSLRRGIGAASPKQPPPLEGKTNAEGAGRPQVPVLVASCEDEIGTDHAHNIHQDNDGCVPDLLPEAIIGSWQGQPPCPEDEQGEGDEHGDPDGDLAADGHVASLKL